MTKKQKQKHDEPFVFLTQYQGKAQQIFIRSIENNANQHTQDFRSGRSMSL